MLRFINRGEESEKQETIGAGADKHWLQRESHTDSLWGLSLEVEIYKRQYKTERVNTLRSSSARLTLGREMVGGNRGVSKGARRRFDSCHVHYGTSKRNETFLCIDSEERSKNRWVRANTFQYSSGMYNADNQ